MVFYLDSPSLEGFKRTTPDNLFTIMPFGVHELCVIDSTLSPLYAVYRPSFSKSLRLGL